MRLNRTLNRLAIAAAAGTAFTFGGCGGGNNAYPFWDITIGLTNLVLNGVLGFVGINVV